jgi:pantoate--beta-alanine ligase
MVGELTPQGQATYNTRYVMNNGDTYSYVWTQTGGRIMRVIQELREMTETARGWLAGGTVALVPTMGNLHAGHLALVQRARRECEICVVSMLADPRQFPSPADFARYPQNPERDLRLLEQLGVDVVFMPEMAAVYPPDCTTRVVLGGALAECLEASLYPQRLPAIATTACKLLLLVRPDVIYLLRNEIHSIAVMQRLVRDLNIDVNICVLPELRDDDGVAWSEFSVLLTPRERRAARVLYTALLSGLGLLLAGERCPRTVGKAMEQVIASEPLAVLEYAVLCDPETLAPAPRSPGRALLMVAARIGTTHLVDGLLWQERPDA